MENLEQYENYEEFMKGSQRDYLKGLQKFGHKLFINPFIALYMWFKTLAITWFNRLKWNSLKRLGDGQFWKEAHTWAKWKKRLIKTFVYTWLIISVWLIFVPVAWMVTAAFTPGRFLKDVAYIPFVPRWMGNPFSSIAWWFDKMGAWLSSPKDFSQFSKLFSYKINEASALPDYLAAFIITLQIAILNTILVVVLSIMVGFAFARFKFKGKKKALLTMMALQMFPSFMGMLALFLIFRMFGWIDNYIYLTLIYAAGSIPYNTFLVRGYFRNIPKSLDEAAAIDGATNIQIIIKILIPLAVPIIGFIAVGAFMAPWLDFILPSILMPTNNTVATWLYSLIQSTASQHYNPLLFMSGALLLVIPIMCVQIYMQKYVIGGLTAGADKG